MVSRKIISDVFKHRLFKSSLIYTVTDAVNKAVPFLLLPLLTHYLLPAEFGIVSNYNIYLYILTIVIGLNLSGVVSINFFKLKKKLLAEYMFNILLIVFVSFLISIILIYTFQQKIFAFLPISPLFLYGALFVTFAQNITLINLELWQLEEKPLSFGICQIMQSCLNLALTLFFILYLKLGWEGRLYAIGLAAITFGSYSLILLRKRGYLKFSFRRDYCIEALKFGVPLLPHTLSIWIRSSVDRIFLTKYAGIEEAGIYATGFQFGLLMSFVTMAFNSAYIPYLYRLLNTVDLDELYLKKLKLVKFTYIYLICVVAVSIIFIFVSNFIVEAILDHRYLRSKEYIIWAIISQTFQGMYLMFVCYIFYVQKTVGLALITFSCSLLQILTSYLLIKKLGGIGSAYSTVIVSFINFIAVFIYSKHVYNMPWNIFKNTDALKFKH